MVNILVMTHGDMAAGMHHTVGMCWENRKTSIIWLSRPDQSLDSLIESLKVR